MADENREIGIVVATVASRALSTPRVTKGAMQISFNYTASLHSSHKFYEDWPLTLLDEDSC